MLKAADHSGDFLILPPTNCLLQSTPTKLSRGAFGTLCSACWILLAICLFPSAKHSSCRALCKRKEKTSQKWPSASNMHCRVRTRSAPGGLCFCRRKKTAQQQPAAFNVRWGMCIRNAHRLSLQRQQRQWGWAQKAKGQCGELVKAAIGQMNACWGL